MPDWEELTLFRILGMLGDMGITYQPKKKKRKRTHGFKKRQKSKGGRKTLARRRKKGRWQLTV